MPKIPALVVMEDLQEDSSTPSSYMSSFSPSSPNFYPFSIDAELWLMAEERIQEILCTIQPALVSEQKRKDVINYVQRLINDYYGIEVLPFGSVPLKTYLPDGDIDLTVLSHQNVEEDLARDFCYILESEEQGCEFEVKDVQYVRAQVKIIKCTVKDIPVDISFNQMAGLSALCFLEKVDQLIGNNHLFKRSIILIKAWCYYESRILGAHYGLISTYALEMLVLHIINLFHSSLSGPLAVLYRFLDYYSTFDWDNYCVSINGPVTISSLPEIVTETPENDVHELLLSREFLQNCRKMYSLPMALETTGHEFAIKHLNIVDPLKENNNLGRSVSKGNFLRIKCALSYGAQRLGQILTLPGECIGMGLEKFFMNTLERNGKGQRPDVDVPIHAFGTGNSEAADLSGDYDSHYAGLQYGQWYHDYTLPVSAQFSPPSSPSQVPNKSTWDNLCQFVRCKRNLFYRWGTEVFVPRLPFCYPYSSQVPAATFSIDEMEKPRGTGTYIPDLTHHSYREIRTPYRDMHALAKARNQESLSHFQQMKLHKSIGQDEYSPKKDNDEDGCSLSLSLEEFPCLPAIKKSPTSANDHYSDQSTDKSAKHEDRCPPSATIMFGTYEHLLTPSMFSSLSATRLKKIGASTTLEPCQSMTRKQKLQELSESNKELVSMKSFHLRDPKDFPPLS